MFLNLTMFKNPYFEVWLSKSQENEILFKIVMKHFVVSLKLELSNA